ncbi:MAG: N-6 DNA methylase [Oscillospiraceae bacterium]|nr:N-6 DNA methylase [Oscillospiraceae bacterium]
MKDLFCSYYTNSDDITSYMSRMISVDNNDVILEPSAGEGIFIDEILKYDKKVHVDALDINSEAIKVLENKYKNNPSVVVRKTDTLLDAQLDKYDVSELWLKETDVLLDQQLDFFGSTDGYYDKVIGNPPYGAWQDYEKRDILKKKYAGHYVKETYSLFLLRCLSVLKMGGKLSFIIPDTFLFLNMHSRLRNILLNNSKIKEILIFPSKFFPGVSFGYSNLSIITLERSNKNEAISNSIRVIQGFENSKEFKLLHNGSEFPDYIKIFNLKQGDILENPQHRFILAETKENSLLNSKQKCLGDVSSIVTGFYTGNNQKFIKALNKDVKGSKNYEIIAENEIYECTSLKGIPNVEKGYVPYIKSSSKYRYLRGEDEWFVQWDCNTIDFYNSNKKSRFQNSSFYFKTGIGIPMVKSKIIKAFLMSGKVFDQSIVGIFPDDPSRTNYILALMNSTVINDLIHIINPTANNSANYVKQIPYIEPEECIISKINELVDSIFELEKEKKYEEIDNIHKIIDSIISEIYK